MERKLYMAVTADRYELPVGVYDSAKEMAITYGMIQQTMNSYISRGTIRRGKVKFIRVH